MRAASTVPASAQCTTISCTENSPRAGRHCIASAGTRAIASRNLSGPLAYWWMRRHRSSEVRGIRSSPGLDSGRRLVVAEDVAHDAADLTYGGVGFHGLDDWVHQVLAVAGDFLEAR